MAKELFVSKSDELADGDRKIVPNGNYEIGVYRVNGELFAYQNVCPHQGGPACEGLLMAKVEEVIAEDKTYQGMTFNHDEMHIVCPWHGWEFDLATGDMVADRKFRLKKYDVVEKEDGILVALSLDQRRRPGEVTVSRQGDGPDSSGNRRSAGQCRS